MKVIINTPLTFTDDGRERTFNPGDIETVKDSLAKSWIAADMAEEYTGLDTKKTAPNLPVMSEDDSYIAVYAAIRGLDKAEAKTLIDDVIAEQQSPVTVLQAINILEQPTSEETAHVVSAILEPVAGSTVKVIAEDSAYFGKTGEVVTVESDGDIRAKIEGDTASYRKFEPAEVEVVTAPSTEKTEG